MEQIKFDNLEQLLHELDQIAESDIDEYETGITAQLADLRREAARMSDDKQARILHKTENWLEVLHSQAMVLKRNATKVFKWTLGQLSDHGLATEFAKEPGENIEQIEWVLAGFEHWVEGQLPESVTVSENDRYHVSWDEHDEAVGFWTVGGEKLIGSVALSPIITDIAQSDGNFPSLLAEAVAQAVIGGLLKGELKFVRLKEVFRENRETVYKLEQRGAASMAYGVPETESDVLSPELTPEAESRLGKEKAAELATLIDEAICRTAISRYTSSGPCIAQLPGGVKVHVFDAVPASPTEETPAVRYRREKVEKALDIAARRHDLDPNELLACFAGRARSRLGFACRAGDVEGQQELEKVIASLEASIVATES